MLGRTRVCESTKVLTGQELIDIDIRNQVYTLEATTFKTIQVHSIYVRPFYRNRGYATRILDKLQEKYKMPMVLECSPLMEVFYLNLGFERIGKLGIRNLEMRRRYK